MPNTPPKVSIIFPVKNEGINVKNTCDSLFNVKTNIEFETIIINDASEDKCCDFLNTYPHKGKIRLINTQGIGPSNARNLGAEEATHDYLLFCDAHLTFENFWIDRLLFHLLAGNSDVVCPAIGSMNDPHIVGYGQSLSQNLKVKWNNRRKTLFETAIIPGGCFIIPKKIFTDVGGFETGFSSWGHEDVEISIKLWLFGYRCHCEPNVKILHLFRTSHPYKVHFDDINYNQLRMAYLHFSEERIAKLRQMISRTSSVKKVEGKVLEDGAKTKRNEYLSKRAVSDDEYFKKFAINF
ncbi:glycosyltransferase [Rossellomorea vietnamensis]|uniref:Glycosyltransferase n=1 Tax=Rossellomorea vietnamensis TaxID=218284 RepID=A0A5D4MC53_9BACI|nr:glycosyltransferase [Rossellomorea vietnamensis]TYR98893.1 glycosyltransferase [Rossellomorea vietnamensis]